MMYQGFLVILPILPCFASYCPIVRSAVIPSASSSACLKASACSALIAELSSRNCGAGATCLPVAPR